MEWLAEKYTNLGGNSSRSLRNSLGRPSLEPIEIMIREAVQNSWDAKSSSSKNINFTISINEFSHDQKILIDEIIKSGPANIPNYENLSTLGKNYILLKDSNTDGLTGPTRAILAKENEDSDYIDFILKSGEERDKEFGGGTYGFGKSSLHRVSKISTIFVFTKTIYQNKLNARLIAYSLGDHDKTLTGRFWYGKKIDETTIDPITDDEAIKLARKLGFIDVESNITGTSILIPFPETGNSKNSESEKPRSSYECFIFMLSAVYWNLWPKMVNFDDENNPPINFEAFYLGKKYELFHPNEHPMLSNFIESYYYFSELNKDKTKTKNKKNIIVEKISHRTFGLDLGILSAIGHTDIDKNINRKDKFQYDLFKSIYDNSPTNTDKEIRSHHIALMRCTELIIKYFEGPLNTDGNYSGVFITSRINEVDKSFAESEPPTHDNWSIEQLNGKDKKIVTHAFNQIKRKIHEMIDVESQSQENSGSFDTMLDLSYMFGNMLTPFSSGVAPSRNKKKQNTSEGIKKTERIGFIKIEKSPEVIFQDSKKIVYISFTPTLLSTKKNYSLASKINTCVDANNIEIVAPKNEPIPEFLFWLDEKNNQINEKVCKIDQNSSGKLWKAAFTVPLNISISVNIELNHG